MNIEYLIQVLQNKITILNTAKSQAFNIGDIDQINAIDKDLLDTQNTFSQLNMLVNMAQSAKAANSTPAEVLASGLGVIQGADQTPTVQGPSASAIVNGYDISAYATDPLHEQKIQSIVSSLPSLLIEEEIDNYIQSIALGSFVSGDMVLEAANTYNVDIPLLVAIMQNDSSFGTAGVGARTNNPGNVGNTGYEEHSYPTWRDGVLAVAEWLSNHRSV